MLKIRHLLHTFIVAAVMLTALTTAAYAAEVNVTVDENPIAWTDAQPYIDSNQRTMIPLRAAAEAMGLSVDWDSTAGEAVFTKTFDSIDDCPYQYRAPDGSYTKELQIRFIPYLHTMVIDDQTGYQKTEYMDTSADIKNGRIYAPIRYLAEATGYSVDWDLPSRTVTITDTSETLGELTEDEWNYHYTMDSLDDSKIYDLMYRANQNYITQYTVDFPYTKDYTNITERFHKIRNRLYWANIEDTGYVTKESMRFSYTDTGLSCFSYCSPLFGSDDDLKKREESYTLARNLIRDMYRKKLLSPTMSEYQRAKAIYNYFCPTVTYAYDSNQAATGWYVLKNRRGICQGYTAAYNLLLKTDGIKCRAQTGYTLSSADGHCWTVAVLDGVEYHIDATWYQGNYFGLTDKQIQKDHYWLEVEIYAE